MSWAGVSALANTSIARTPAPAATVYGPLRVSQPPSSGGSSPENGCGPAAAACASSDSWSTRLSRARISPLRASTNVRYAAGSAAWVSSTIVS